MGAFIIDPKGKRHNVADGIHIDYFEEYFEDILSDRQISHFLKVLNITPDGDSDVLRDQFRRIIDDLIEDADYQKFYAGVSEIGYLCGTVDDIELHLRMTDLDCIVDAHIRLLLDLLVKKNIQIVRVDFVDPNSDRVKSESYTQKSFIEHL